ncbi:MAG: beta-lactamase family protein [Oscillospiraceae bacterium]|nr:beta-lactamase family protein [Oscillospiraceae bacterium]
MSNFNAALTKQRMTEHISARLDAGALAGVCAGVWVNGEQVVDVCLGQRDPAAGAPMIPDALFRLASMTKPVAGTAAMQMVEAGKLELDAPISRWLPRFEKMEVAVATPEGEILATRPAERPITLRMLLTHSSGLGSGAAGNVQFAAIPREKRTCLADAVDAYSEMALDFQPFTTQMYSGMCGLDVACRLVEVVSGIPYGEYAKKNIFDPLEMSDTTYAPTPEQLARAVAMVDARGGKLIPVDLSPRAGFTGFVKGYTGGGAGLFSTLEDYSHLALMFLNGGEYKGRRILKAETVAEMATPQLPEHFAGMWRRQNWGLSMRTLQEKASPVWVGDPAAKGQTVGMYGDCFYKPDAALIDAGQPLTVGSFGWSGAYGTHFWVDPAKKTVAVYMSNLADGGGAGAPTAFEFERDVMAGWGE